MFASTRFEYTIIVIVKQLNVAYFLFKLFLHKHRCDAVSSDAERHRFLMSQRLIVSLWLIIPHTHTPEKDVEPGGLMLSDSRSSIMQIGGVVQRQRRAD